MNNIYTDLIDQLADKQEPIVFTEADFVSFKGENLNVPLYVDWWFTQLERFNKGIKKYTVDKYSAEKRITVELNNEVTIGRVLQLIGFKDEWTADNVDQYYELLKQWFECGFNKSLNQIVCRS